MSTLLIILLIVLLLGGLGTLPTWPHSSNWGYFPSGIIGLFIIVILILAFTGRL